MGGDERQQDARDEQDVQRVEPGDHVLAGVFAAEEEEGDPGADQRQGDRHALGDPQTGAGEQVVGEGVAGQALGQGQRQQADADQPVELARLAVRTGEEHSERVHHHAGDEQQGGPVVHLPHQQATADVEADVQSRGVRLGHHDALERLVGAVVDDVSHGGLEEEGQERAGQQQDDERVQRDLAQQERPVVGEDLPQVALEEVSRADAVVDEAACARYGLRNVSGAHAWPPFSRTSASASPRSQKLGPGGTAKSAVATR
ncbi:hypothetical protein Aros01_06964 [Streptosporangium roseum]